MNFKKLTVWNRAIDLTVDVYEITRVLPAEERYGLSAQMRSAALSVPSNIAEGEGRLTFPDQLRFLGHARGSLYELETQFVVCDRLGYIPASPLSARIAETAKLLNGTIRYVRSKTKS